MPASRRKDTGGLDGVGDVPDVDVHAGHQSPVIDLESEGLPLAGIAAEDDLLVMCPVSAYPEYSTPCRIHADGVPAAARACPGTAVPRRGLPAMVCVT